MKKLLKFFMILAMILSVIVPVTVFAIGDGNIDSGGGGMENGTSTNVWSPGNEGVRVTVVRSSDHAVVTTPIDLTNKHPDNIQMHFNKVSKIQYNNGSVLVPKTSKYKYINPTQAIPSIISDSGNNNIEAIKKYFCSEYIIKRVAEKQA